MAKPNKRQAKLDPKCRCENCGSVMIFGRDLERRQYLKKRDGPLMYCCCPGYKWTARRMGKLRRYADNAHRAEASTHQTLHPSEFRTTTAQLLTSSSYHFGTPDSSIDPNFSPIPALIYDDFASMLQANQSQLEAMAHHHGALAPRSPVARWVGETADQEPWKGAGVIPYTTFKNQEASYIEHNLISDSSGASKTTIKVPRYRVFRQCRMRRRKSRTATPTTPSSRLPLTPRGFALESAVGFYSNEQDTSNICTQSKSDPVDIELMASFLRLV